MGIWQFNQFAYFKYLSKLYFVTDLEEQSLFHANIPRHKSGYKLGGKRKKEENEASEPGMCWGGGVIYARGGGNLPARAQTTILSAHQTEKHYITLSQW